MPLLPSYRNQSIDLRCQLISSKWCFQTFCLKKPTTWFLHKQDIGREWVKRFSSFCVTRHVLEKGGFGVLLAKNSQKKGVKNLKRG